MRRILKQRAVRLVARGFQSYWRATRGLTMGAQGVVLDANGRVLLIRHTYRPGWHFPGGGVERGESPTEALARELREEAGVVFESPPPLFGLYTNFKAFPSDHIALYVLRDWSRPVVPKPNHEIAESGFFPVEELPEGVIDPVRRRLDEIAGRAHPIETW